MEEGDPDVHSKILGEGRDGVWALHRKCREQGHGLWGRRSGIETFLSSFFKKNLFLIRDRNST